MEARQVSRILEKAFTLLESLVNTYRPVSKEEVATHLDLAPSEAGVLLDALVRQGYVVHDRRHATYALGDRCFELAALLRGTHDLRAVALPHLVELNRRIGETVYLGVYHAGGVVYIVQLEHPAATPAVPTYTGQRAPAFCVAPGRVLLAHQPAYEVERVLSGHLAPRDRPAALTDRIALLAELARTRERGYGSESENWRRRSCSLAAPVRDHCDMVVAAIGCSVPADRFDDAPESALVTVTRSAAEDISSALGHHTLVTRGSPRASP
jgi:IclR family transcriptional regulator, KDG regulon repressor